MWAELKEIEKVLPMTCYGEKGEIVFKGVYDKRMIALRSRVSRLVLMLSINREVWTGNHLGV